MKVSADTEIVKEYHYFCVGDSGRVFPGLCTIRKPRHLRHHELSRHCVLQSDEKRCGWSVAERYA